MTRTQVVRLGACSKGQVRMNKTPIGSYVPLVTMRLHLPQVALLVPDVSLLHIARAKKIILMSHFSSGISAANRDLLPSDGASFTDQLFDKTLSSNLTFDEIRSR